MTLTLDSGSRVATLTGQTFTRVQTNVLEFGDIVEAVHADDGDASFVRLKLIDGRLLALNPVGIDPVSAQTAVDAINGVIRQS